MSGPSGSQIGTGALGVGDFGRGSGTLAAHGKHGAGDIAVATTK